MNQGSDNLAQPPRRNSIDWFNSLRALPIDWSPLFGYDAFISYKRYECSLYAASLERQLRKKDIACFFDDNDLPAGSMLTATVRAGLIKSRFLLVVVSPGSLESKYIESEIRTFRERSEQIVPIRLAQGARLLGEQNASTQSTVAQLLGDTGRVWIDEHPSVTGADGPSVEVVHEIVKLFGIHRANARRRVILTALFILILSAAVLA